MLPAQKETGWRGNVDRPNARCPVEHALERKNTTFCWMQIYSFSFQRTEEKVAISSL
jgi:hypothetical protein